MDLIRTGGIQFFRFIIFILFQIFFINNLKLSTFINPYFYIMFIMLMPLYIQPVAVVLAGFFTGIFMDMFMDTAGMHTMACTFIAYFRIYFIRATLSKEQLDVVKQPDIASTGIQWFLFYTVTFTLLHHTLLFFLEVFSFSDFFGTIERILMSSAMSIVMIMLTHFLFFNVRAKN